MVYAACMTERIRDARPWHGVVNIVVASLLVGAFYVLTLTSSATTSVGAVVFWALTALMVGTTVSSIVDIAKKGERRGCSMASLLLTAFPLIVVLAISIRLVAWN